MATRRRILRHHKQTCMRRQTNAMLKLFHVIQDSVPPGGGEADQGISNVFNDPIDSQSSQAVVKSEWYTGRCL